MSTPNPMPGPTSASASASWRELMSGVVAESLRVVSAHSRHFLALSLLFVLPLSSLLLLLLSFFNPDPPPPSSDDPPQSLLRLPSASLPLPLPLAVVLLLIVALLFLPASSAISHSVRSGFFGRPVRLLPALSTLPSSLPRLLLTLPFLLLPLLLLSAPLLLSLRLLPSPLALPLSFLSALPLAAFSLSLPIAALEPSSYGLAPLRRSARLISCMPPVPICLYILFAGGILLALWGCRLREIGGLSAGWRHVAPVVARTVLGLAVVTLLFLYWMVSAAVMYLYCRAVHGELAEEIAEEFACEYVFLPFDKVPRVVSVVRH